MTAIFQVTKFTQHRLDEWQHKAFLDHTVWPYMAFDPHRPALSSNDGDDWKDVYLMDEDCKGVLQFCPDRGRGNNDATISVWVLNFPDKHRISGHLLRHVQSLTRRFGVNFLRASCHASNIDSEKILRRRFGNPWGICPSNAWNGLTGKWEESLHFKVSVEEYGKGFPKWHTKQTEK